MVGTILIALAPVAGLIALGFAFRRFGVVADVFWPQAERLSYFVLLPTLFAYSLAMTDLTGVPVGSMALVLVLPLLAASLMLIAAKPWLAPDEAAFTSVFQGAIRFNNYVALGAASALVGTGGLALAAVASAAIVPTVNVLCILVFARLGKGRATPGRILRMIATNPLILGLALGGAMQALDLRFPPGIDGLVRSLGQAALPLGLLCVGAAFDPGALRTGLRAATLSSLVKFGAMPAMTLAACLALGVSGAPATVALLFHAMPTASSAYILARQLGGDAPLMAGIITFQTLAAAVAIPVVLILGLPWLGG